MKAKAPRSYLSLSAKERDKISEYVVELAREQIEKDGSQVEYLNGRMAEIFKKNGFPQQFFDGMLGEVVTAEEGNV